jgi:hypothetical protein
MDFQAATFTVLIVAHESRGALRVQANPGDGLARGALDLGSADSSQTHGLVGKNFSSRGLS